MVELLLDRREYLLREDRPVVHPLPCPSLCEQAFARCEEEGGETDEDEQYQRGVHVWSDQVFM